jgi:GTPase
MFVDHIKVTARAGDGGNGIVHWIRGKFSPKGGPDGGNGGRGGDVVLLVDNSTDSLRAYFFDNRLYAEPGQNGGRQLMTGRGGKHKIAKVPPGTMVFAIDPETGERGEMVADLVNVGEKYVLCTGGKGGRGNAHFKSPINRAPNESEPGEPGGRGEYEFELRQIADAGMVGFPNAGKSSLVSTLSTAHPKIASYPFTTLKPMVGMIEYPAYHRTTVADIPGLIEGAHENRGLGHEFLRHIMRCRILLFVVDTAGSEGREPWDDIALLRKEVSLYSEELSERPWMIITNKMDLPEAKEKLKILKQRFKKQEIITTNTLDEAGVAPLKERLHEYAQQLW